MGFLNIMDKEARREVVELSEALLNVSIICFGRGTRVFFFFFFFREIATVKETLERGKWL